MKFTDYIDRIEAKKIAIIDDNSKINYGELRRRAGICAYKLQLQYGKSNTFLLKTNSTVDFVVTLLGIIYSGNIPIPIPENSPDSILEKYKGISNAVSTLSPLTLEDFAHSNPIYSTNENLPVIVMLTSGTTGDPKGVLISNENLIHSCKTVAEYLDYYSNNSAAVVLPMYYSYSLLSQVLCQLMIGGFVRLFSNFTNILYIEKEITELCITTLCGVPSTYVAFAKIHGMQRLNMSSIKILCSAGAAMDRAVFPIIKEIFPKSLFFNNYGMTEAAPRISFINENDSRFFEPTCGRVIQGMKIKVVDPENHEEVLDGKEGMLTVKGPNITKGYLNNKSKTEAAFTQEDYLITGDIGYLDDNYIFITGRYDDIFNVGGEKVSPVQIERELNKIPEVVFSGVTGVDDKNRGKLPAAFLVLNGEISRSEILNHISNDLSPVSIPAYFYKVKKLPMTSNGKLQRRFFDPNANYVEKEID